MRKVIVYGDLDSLSSSDFYRTIREDVHFAESSRMRNMLKDKGLFDSVFLFKDLISEIVPEWSKENQRIRCLTLISECLRI